MVEISESWNTHQGELLIGSGTIPRERSMPKSTKLKGVGNLNNIAISDTKIQSLEFAQLFFTVLPSIHFRMVINILCHYMVEVCDLFIYFDIRQGLQLRECINLRRDFELWTFK